MKPLSGKVAIVTGASAPRGIGNAIVRRLAGDGASVIATDLSGSLQEDGDTHDKTELLHALSAELLEAGSAVMPLNMDVTDTGDVRRCIAAAMTEFGRVDILVNNAGSLAGSDKFLSTTPDQWETSFRVNILGPMMLTQAVIPEMREAGGGRIINIGSTGSLGAEPGFGAYTTMKHGLVGMTKTIAAEFGVDGILCNIVCPGYIMTDMHAAANERLAKQAAVSVDEVRKQRYANVAVRDAGQPEDVAEAVSYLAGPNSAYVTGICLPVSGGVPFGI
ncbi:MAG: SDR family oxidoreductase [Pseudomonadota bacterium]